MANNYLVFSEKIIGLTPEEAAWCAARLDHLGSLGDISDDEQTKFLPGDDEYNQDNLPGFEYEFKNHNTSLWLFAEENGNVEHVAQFVREFLARFRRESAFSLTYASYCSKPRIGEFGGGAIFVTAEKILWQDAYDWVQEQVELRACGKDCIALDGPDVPSTIQE